MASDPQPSTVSDDARLLRAHQQFKLIVTAEADLRQRMLEDYRFVDDDHGQWPLAIRQQREAEGRPWIQIDRLSGQIRQTLNQLRDGRPAILVHPVDDGADPEKAEIRQGIIRRIETDSFADVAYLTAAEHQLKIGRGYWRLLTEYDDAAGTTQSIKIATIDNPFGVYYDPAAREPDLADARFAFLPEDLELDDYRDRFGAEPPGSLETFRSTGDAAPEWFPQGKIRIAEYFHVEQTRTGRGRAERRVTWYLLNAVEILDRRDIPGPYIPIVPVLGERANLDGQIDLKGIVRRARDSQRMLNYHRSAEVELMALGTKHQPVIDPESIEGYEQIWEQRTRRNWGYLPQRSFDLKTGREYRAPYLLPIDSASLQAYSLIADQSEADLRAVTGFFDVQGQERRAEQSGRAILARQRQAEMGNSHFLANLGRAIRLTGRILNAWIPVYYDTPRQLRIVGADNQDRPLIVHAGMPEAAAQLGGPAMRPEDVIDVSVGRYDITVDMGPSTQTKRIEAQEALSGILQAAPQLLQVIGDLYFKNLDWAEARPIAERLKKLLPPELRDDGPGPGGPLAVPPQVQQQLQALAQQHQQLTQAVSQLTEERDRKAQQIAADQQAHAQDLAQRQQQARAEQTLELEKAQLAARTKLQIAEMELATKREIAALEASWAASAAPRGAEADRP